MKRRDLVATIRKAAHAHGLTFDFVREGGNHEKWRCGAVPVIIPRHREINEFTAEGIFKDLEELFGERWWR